MTSQLDFGEFRIADLDAGFIAVRVQCSTYREPLSCGGATDQFHYGLPTYQRFAPPILGDEGKQAVFHFVPFARAWRKMTHGESQADLVRQLLQGNFPEPRTVAIAAPPPSAVISKCRARGKRCAPISSHQQ